MKCGAYYNENDAQKAAWLRELIRENVVAPGEVDERSIADVQPEDVRSFRQCHFFAGIGVWSYALRLAGWPDDRPVWTGSCPCPSFSCAGKGKGFDDPRHLWPAWFGLVEVCQPPVLFGEQADDAIGFGWLDLVQTDLERAAYAVGKAVLGACGVGAPHIRQRLYFCAHAEAAEILARSCEVRARTGTNPRQRFRNGSRVIASADSASSRRQDAREYRSGSPLLPPRSEQRGGVGSSSDSDGRFAGDRKLQRSREQRLLTEDRGTGDNTHAAESGRRARIANDDARQSDIEGSGDSFTSGDATQRRLAMCGRSSRESRFAPLPDEAFDSSQPIGARLERHSGHERNGRGPGWLDADAARCVAAAGATRGFWRDCDWWYGRDGKYRPIESGLFPLAHGASSRVLKLRGYGDAIVPQVAAEFISAFIEIGQQHAS